MRQPVLFVFLVFLTASCANGQQANSSVPTAQLDVQAGQVKVYAGDPGMKLPELLPLNLPPIQQDEKCKVKQNGKVTLSLLVDTAGRPRNIMFLEPLGTELDRLALRIAAADRFTPGMMGNKAVITAESLEIGIQSCVVELADSAGKRTYSLRLRVWPTQRLASLLHPAAEAVLASDNDSWKDPQRIDHVGNGVSAPSVLNNPEAEFTDAARRAGFTGTCKLSLVVDAQGMPQNIEVMQLLGYGLEEEALSVVNRYRFKPAMKNGEPVAVKITVEANFRLYKK